MFRFVGQLKPTVKSLQLSGILIPSELRFQFLLFYIFYAPIHKYYFRIASKTLSD